MALSSKLQRMALLFDWKECMIPQRNLKINLVLYWFAGFPTGCFPVAQWQRVDATCLGSLVCPFPILHVFVADKAPNRPALACGRTENNSACRSDPDTAAIGKSPDRTGPMRIASRNGPETAGSSGPRHNDESAGDHPQHFGPGVRERICNDDQQHGQRANPQQAVQRLSQ